MENASKALIIAGAILISILLIGIGMFIYNSAQKPITESGQQMDEYAVMMFNQKFESFDGVQSGSNVKSLISAVITSNSKDENTRPVTVKIGGTEQSDLSAARASITNSATYDVKIVYTGSIVSGIEITRK